MSLLEQKKSSPSCHKMALIRVKFRLWITTLVSLLSSFLFNSVDGESGGWGHGDLDKPYKITFPRGENSERDLILCPDKFTPCNVIQNPFFYPFTVKRLCRCPNKECPETFLLKRSLDTVFLNNREQMKFCEELPRCRRDWSLLRIGEDQLPYHLNCFCHTKKRYWYHIEPFIPPARDNSGNLDEKSQSHSHGREFDGNFQVEENGYQDAEELFNKRHLRDAKASQQVSVKKTYKCEKMEPCRGGKRPVCGTLRTDLYATYQNCTCLSGRLCLPSLQNGGPPSSNVNEVLYNGIGRISSCSSEMR